MTREEKAIIYFKDMRKRFCEDHLNICPKGSIAYKVTLAEKDFYDTAIKALEQEPCDDCVSRQAVEDAIAEEIVNGESLGYAVAYDILSDLPSVTPRPKMGHWIDDNDGHGTSCSECDKWYPHSYLTKREIIYCCRCGTKMEAEE